MKWVKQTIHYWCDDTRSKHCGQNGITVAILDTGISPILILKIVSFAFRDFYHWFFRKSSFSVSFL